MKNKQILGKTHFIVRLKIRSKELIERSPYKKFTRHFQEVSIYQLASDQGLSPRFISSEPKSYPSIIKDVIVSGYTIISEKYDLNLDELLRSDLHFDKADLKLQAHDLLSRFHALGYIHRDLHLRNIVALSLSDTSNVDRKWKLALIDFEESLPLDSPDYKETMDDRINYFEEQNYIPHYRPPIPINPGLYDKYLDYEHRKLELFLETTYRRD